MSKVLFDFGNKKPEKKEAGEKKDKQVKTFDGPGRGRKQCPECNIYLGVRNKVCLCGHEFKKRDKAPVKAKKAKVVEEESDTSNEKVIVPNTNRSYKEIVFAPAGKPSVPLNSFDEEVVLDWASKVRSNGLDHEIYYSTSAIIYYLRYYTSVFSDDFARAKSLIREWDKDEVGI